MKKNYSLKRAGILLALLFFSISSFGWTFTVELNDTGWNGWSGGTLTVFVNGTPVLTDITLATGKGPETYTFTANTGDEITTSYTAGSSSYQNWYEIKDTIGVVIGSDGISPSTPSGITTPIIAEAPTNLNLATSNIGGPSVAGNGSVTVDISNCGFDTITSATLNWEVNGVAQTPTSWIATLYPPQSRSAILGYYNFLAGNNYIVKAWTSEPNGGVDEKNSNDTIIQTISISPSMTVRRADVFTNDTSVAFYLKEDVLVFGVNIQTANSSNPLTLGEIYLSGGPEGNIDTDISKINVYTTGSSKFFMTTNSLWSGTTINNPIQVVSSLLTGNNYIWITVDISENPVLGNKIDINCDSIRVNGNIYTTNIIEPFGKRTITEKPEHYNFMPANIVVGQQDFYSQSQTTNQSTAVGASNSAVSSKGVLAIGSQPDGRILLWNKVPSTNGVPADVVLGDINFTSTYDGPTAVFTRNIEGVCFSPDGEKLIASDGNNNRVLIWNTIPTTNGQPADVVIGHKDFTSETAGVGPDKLRYPTGIIVSPDGKLIIVDRNNNRVLVYNQIPTTNGASADLVIGQPDFYTNSNGRGNNKLFGPWYTALSPDGKFLISDGMNHRILIFNEFPTENGDTADVVIGQNEFGITGGGTSPTKLKYPIGVTVSPFGVLAIGDFGNDRVLIYNEIPTTNGANADIVLGQPDFYTSEDFYGGVNEKSMRSPYGINYDINGRLFVNGRDMHRLMIYGEVPTDTANVSVTITADNATPSINESIVYSVAVSNAGPKSTDNVVVECALPSLFKLISNAAERGEYNSEGRVWTIPVIASGETINLTLSGVVQNGGGTTVAYSKIVASSAADADWSDNSASFNVDISNNIPVLEVPSADTIVNRTSTKWIPISISDTDCDLNNLTLRAVSLNETLLNDTGIQLSGENGTRYFKATPVVYGSGVVDIEFILSDGFNEVRDTLKLTVLNNNANLDEILTDGTVISGFSPSQLQYTIELPITTTTPPAVTATIQDPNATYNIVDAPTVPGITTVEVTAEDGITKQTYMVNFVHPVAPDNDASLSDLSVLGATIENFSPIQYTYSYSLPYGTTTVPTISATLNNASAGMRIRKTTELPGQDSVIVTAVDNVTIKAYVINYTVEAASDNNNIHSVKVDGEDYLPFDPAELNYSIEYPYGTTEIPAITVITEHLNAQAVVTDAESMPGITTIKVTAQNGSVKTYSFEFTVVPPSSNAKLSNIIINSEFLTGFDSNTLRYVIELPAGTSDMPVVEPVVNDTSATTQQTDLTTIPGRMTITVTAQDGSTEEYLLIFTYDNLSNDATLSDIKVEGASITGFNASTFTYSVQLPAGTTTVPDVTATTTDMNAEIQITDAANLQETTIIQVTAEDSYTTKTYEVSFTVEATNSIDIATLSESVKLYPNPTSGIVHIDVQDEGSIQLEVQVYNAQGKLVYDKELSWYDSDLNQSIDLTSLKKGMHIVKLTINNEILIHKLIIE